MGQSATLYRITENEFNRLSRDPAKFSVNMTHGRATFDQNFEGILFVLAKLASNAEKTLLQEIIYPHDWIGKNADFSASDLDVDYDLLFSEDESIGYLSHEKVKAIQTFLDKISKRDLLKLYDPHELNNYGVYPTVWHSDESPNQAFNKRHIEEGFDLLVTLFKDAVFNKNIVLIFASS